MTRPGAALVPAPGLVRDSLWVSVIAAILRGGFVRKDLIESPVVMIHVVAVRTSNRGRAGAQIASDSGDRYIEDIIPEPPAVGPTARDHAVAEAWLNQAD